MVDIRNYVLVILKRTLKAEEKRYKLVKLHVHIVIPVANT
jgi:hypothetical protein